MLKKSSLLLIGLICIPVLILVWFSVQLEQKQQQLVNHQFQGLVELQLEAADDLFQAHFRRLEKALKEEAFILYEAKDKDFPLDTLRSIGKSSPYIEQVFIRDSDQATLYPTFETATQRELQFLKQTEVLLNSTNLFVRSQESATPNQAPQANTSRTPYSAQLKSEPVAPKLQITQSNRIQSSPQRSSDSIAFETDAVQSDVQKPNSDFSGLQSGWIAWYNNTQLQHIYWQETPDNQVIGFSMNSARLLSDLINLLPDQNEASTTPALKNAVVTLHNSRGELSYEWGAITYDAVQQSKPIKILHLNHPLGSWRLDFHSTSLIAPPSQWLEKSAFVLLTLLGLSLLAWLIYKEQTRESRLALQRVNFVNQVSHELKTPLTNVRMYAELLERQLGDDQTKPKRYLDVINNESQRLTRLIENVLSFSKLGRESLEISLQQGSLKDGVDNTLAAFSPALIQRGINPILDCECDAAVMIDVNCLEQILNNLLSNCEKYAANSGDLVVSCWQEGDRSYIRVQDNGPGIPASSSHSIFEQFYRVSNKLTDGVSGTGIGLNIAKELAIKHGGNLELEPSEHGASFLLSLYTPPLASTNLDTIDTSKA